MLLDVSGRKRAEEELKAALVSLKEADRRKNEFLNMLSHELRNPLAPIRNSIYTISGSRARGFFNAGSSRQSSVSCRRNTP